MPTTRVDYSAAHAALNKETASTGSFDNVISTPFGLSILEIQGELNLPTTLTQDAIDNNASSDYVANFASVDDLYHAVKFGQLDFDAKDPTKVTLYIGKSQRLLGSMVNLDPPLGVMKVPHHTESHEDAAQDDSDQTIKIIDVIKKKIIFKHRPLPIM